MPICWITHVHRHAYTNFRPPSACSQLNISLPPEIHIFEKLVLRDISSLEQQRTFIPYNIPLSKNMPLLSLKLNIHWLLSQQTKGGGIVIQDTHQYKNENLRWISNNKHYVRMVTDPTKELQTEISNITRRGLESGFISKNEHLFLNTKNPSNVHITQNA